MSRESISENVKRRLYAESMGRCMNPECLKELFIGDGDIVEKAHIIPYCKDVDNSYENLVILCPNCHTQFDKLAQFSSDEVMGWKQDRKEELEKLFCKKFSSFDELKNVVAPLLEENKRIFENYYLDNEKSLWDKFEGKLLTNNKKLKLLLENNLNLIQRHKTKEYSNLTYVNAFLAHVDEFEITRANGEKNRKVLFPKEINSMFGVTPVNGFLLPSTESLEKLICQLKEQGSFEAISLGNVNPYLQLNVAGTREIIFLKDTPRLRQLYFDYNCFTNTGVRLESLNYALGYIKSKRVNYEFLEQNNLREILIDNTKMIFVYEYCMSVVALQQLFPEEGDIIVNLHNWNGDGCISSEAYQTAQEMGVDILTMKGFYAYINRIRRKG